LGGGSPRVVVARVEDGGWHQHKRWAIAREKGEGTRRMG